VVQGRPGVRWRVGEVEGGSGVRRRVTQVWYRVGQV